MRLYVGGTDRDSEIKRLEKSQPQIVIGTIGKIKDLAIDANILKIFTAKTIIIDEADMVFEKEDGTVFTFSAKDMFLDTSNSRYLFKKTSSDSVWSFAIIRPTAKSTTMTVSNKSISN